MTRSTRPSAIQRLGRGLFGWFENLRTNPVLVKEMRGRSRGPRMSLVLTVYLLFMGGLVSLSIGSFGLAETTGIGVGMMETVGKTIFGVTIIVQFLMASLIAPALTAGSISSEREHKTYDILRTTLLPARALVLGKLFSAFLFILLLLATSLPLLSIGFLFGGITLEEVFAAYVMLIVTALTFSSIGLYFSSKQRRTLVANVLAYAATLFVIAGIPLLLFVGQLALMPLMFSGFSGAAVPASYTWLALLGWLVGSLNPITAALASEATLLEGQMLWIASLPLGSGRTVTLPSPWLIFVVFYTFLSLLLLRRSILSVRRPET